MIEWSVIRQEYEQGASLRDIVARHGSSIATISRVARHEGWIRPVTPLIETRNVKQVKHVSSTPPLPVSMPMDAVSIARAGLKQLAQHVQGQTTEDTLPIASHKSLSDALTQYVKVLVTAPHETEDGLLIPLEQLLPETRTAIRQLLADDKQQQAQEEEGAS